MLPDKDNNDGWDNDSKMRKKFAIFWVCCSVLAQMRATRLGLVVKFAGNVDGLHKARWVSPRHQRRKPRIQPRRQRVP